MDRKWPRRFGGGIEVSAGDAIEIDQRSPIRIRPRPDLNPVDARLPPVFLTAAASKSRAELMFALLDRAAMERGRGTPSTQSPVYTLKQLAERLFVKYFI